MTADVDSFVLDYWRWLHEPATLRRYRHLSDTAYGPTTELIGGVLSRMAAVSKRRQYPELWHIDYLWYPSRGIRSQLYYSGQKERRWPIGAPAFAIEHENYGHFNVAAAFLRLLGVRAANRVLIGWSYAPASSIKRLLRVRDHAVKSNCWPARDKVEVIFHDANSTEPTLYVSRVGRTSCDTTHFPTRVRPANSPLQQTGRGSRAQTRRATVRGRTAERQPR